MKSRYLLPALLLAATCAHAQETTWKVEFLGLSGHTYGWESQTPHPNYTLAGLIRAEDLNQDQMIEESELLEFRIGNDGISGDFSICDTWEGSSENHCSLSGFMFAPNAPLGPALRMTAVWVDNDWSQLKETRVRIVTGERYEYSVYKPPSGGQFAWTDQTTLRVTQVSAVPEPAAGALLAAGLALLMGGRRLRRRARAYSG